MLLDRPNWPAHRPWLIFFVLGTAGALGWFLAASLDLPAWPGGSSLPGFTFGVVGGLIIFFEILLALRKKVRAWAIGKAPGWLRAHIWLGLWSLPLLVLHSGLRLGGTLSTVLMMVLVLLIASGVWGLVLQNLLPKRRLDDIPGEIVYAQIDFLVTQLLTEADQLVATVCGQSSAAPLAAGPGAAVGVVGALLPVGSGRGHVLGAGGPLQTSSDAELLAAFYRDDVGPFLRAGPASLSRLANVSQAAILFNNLKARLPPAAHGVLDALEIYCQRRRHWDRQVRLHFWLHNWLWVHYPLSAALLVLMTVHVFVALKYW